MSKKITYDYDTIIGLNHPDLKTVDQNLLDFFLSLPSYQITKEIRFHYPNKHNSYFNKKQLRQKRIISNDPEVIKKIRVTLSKITDQNFKAMSTNLKEILGDQEYKWDEVADYFHGSMIDNVKIVTVFVDLLVDLEEKYPDLVKHVHHKILKQAFNPVIYTDNITETGEEKTKRWQISNSLIIVQIYQSNKYSHDFLMKILIFWIEQIKPDNLTPFDIIVKIFPKLKGILLPEPLIEKLTDICADKAYPGRLRLMLEIPKPALIDPIANIDPNNTENSNTLNGNARKWQPKRRWNQKVEKE